MRSWYRRILGKLERNKAKKAKAIEEKGEKVDISEGIE